MQLTRPKERCCHECGGDGKRSGRRRPQTPTALGALGALYEHSVFTQGAVWRSNPWISGRRAREGARATDRPRGRASTLCEVSLPDLVKGVKKGAGGARSGGHAGHILLCDYDPRASAAAGSVGWMRVLVEPSCRSVGSSTLPGNDHRFGSWEHRQPRTLGRAEHCRDCRYLGARRTVSVPRESVESVATSLLAL